MSDSPSQKPSGARDYSAETIDPSSAQHQTPTMQSPAKAPAAPKQIGAYKMLEMIGEGGFGTVWLAEQQGPIRRRVALKIVKPGMDSKAVIARFEQERQALGIMNHPCIAKIFDAGTAPDGRPYFVMEYVPGDSITAYCDKNRLDITQRLELFIPVCEAVQHAHHKGIIHRDLKPNNVLVTSQQGSGPAVKVIDFGVAKALSQTLTEKTIFTEQGQILGTPEYMSPEQAEMGAMDIDTRTDVYSLGVMLYELLAGALPFEAKELRSKGYNEIQRIIREVDPPRPSTLLRSMDGKQSADLARRRQMKLAELEGQLRRELEWIPLKAMRKERQQRYATPIALADDIRNHLAGRPLTAGPESMFYRAKKFVRRNRAAVFATSLIAMSLIAGAIVSTIGFVKASRNARLARQENATLRQVIAFTNGMLSSANPAAGLSRDVTVKQILDITTDQLDSGALKGQPHIEAAVRAILGRTYRQLSESDKSEIQWQKALELESATRSTESEQATVAMTSIGLALIDKGKFDDAQKSLERSLAIQRRILPADHADTADTINVMGMLADARGDFKEAEARYREALKIYQDNPGVGTRQADGMTNLAGILNKLGNNKEAVTLARKALEIRRVKYGERSFEVWNSLANLAALLEADADLGGAERAGREALEIARTKFDSKNRFLAASLTNLAHVLWLRATPEALKEATLLQNEAMEIAIAVDGPESRTVAQSADMLGVMARDAGDHAASVQQYRRVLAIRTKLLPAEHPEIAGAMSQLADSITRAGDPPSEAVELATKSLEIRKRIFPPGHWLVWNTTSVLGGALAASGDFTKAEPLLLEAFKGLEAGSAIGKKPLRDAANRLIVLYEKSGNIQQAEAWNRKKAGL